MNGMYRWTRHIYDASRKYYLFGRDRLIKDISCKPGDVVIEVGCGTARNLIKLARRYPDSLFYGVDASDEMLKTAHASVHAAGLSDRIFLAQGYAQNFNPQRLFNITSNADKIFFSYSLSMIPQWQDSIRHAKSQLNNKGELWIADFADLKSLPRFIRKGLLVWLKLFHVIPRTELLIALSHSRSTVSKYGPGRYFVIAKLGDDFTI